MTPGELQKRLREKSLPNLLLLYGEETFFVDRTLREIIEQTVPAEARDFNLEIFHGKGCRVATVLDAARTLPVFSPRRLVIVRDLHALPADELDRFVDYLKDPVP
ncbi:MAG: DNA polymerase III subunit delta, partial [Syntrophotalea sp.]|uniref:DNA polymerase III subunit delta n=1 Tax=Syntrophotalea sp. TaxID=2812029 RepID=UPI003D1095A8